MSASCRYLIDKVSYNVKRFELGTLHVRAHIKVLTNIFILKLHDLQLVFYRLLHHVSTSAGIAPPLLSKAGGDKDDSENL